jgi:hypothetical protein
MHVKKTFSVALTKPHRRGSQQLQESTAGAKFQATNRATTRIRNFIAGPQAHRNIGIPGLAQEPMDHVLIKSMFSSISVDLDDHVLHLAVRALH